MRRSTAGFTLLEVLVAIAIFAFVAAAAMQTMANSDFMSASGKRARDLRMLAERKLGEVLAFEEHYDANSPAEGDFSDWTEFQDRFKDWKWQLDVRDVTAFGIATDENAQYLFGAPSEDEKAQAASQGAGGSQPAGQQPAGTTQQKQGEMQQLRELTLRVTASDADGPSDSVELVLFAPEAPKKGPAAAGGAK